MKGSSESDKNNIEIFKENGISEYASSSFFRKISGLLKTPVVCICVAKRGEIIPNEHSFKRVRAYSEVLGYVIQYEDDLKATLTEQQKEIYEKLKECETELHSMNELQAFTEGLKLATRLLIEVMQDKGEA